MIIRTITIDCDRCRTEYDGSSNNSAEVRAWAQKDGWRVAQGGGTDYCPKCVAELKDEEHERVRRFAMRVGA
jgi:hypothetical protein